MWPALARWWPQVVDHSFGLIPRLLEKCAHLSDVTWGSIRAMSGKSGRQGAHVCVHLAPKSARRSQRQATDNCHIASATDSSWVAHHCSVLSVFNDRDHSGASSRLCASQTESCRISTGAADPADLCRLLTSPFSAFLSAPGSNDRRFSHAPSPLESIWHGHRDHGPATLKTRQVVRVELQRGRPQAAEIRRGLHGRSK